MPTPFAFLPVPPLSDHGVDLGWVMARAFGPPDSRILPPLDPTGAVQAARRLGLAARVASRTPQELLAREVGPAGCRTLAFERLRVTATNRELGAVFNEVSAVAEARKLPLVWLKFAALRQRGVVPEGYRDARDLDLLAPEAQGQELHALLLERGFRAASSVSAEHQLPPLLSASGAAVEVHRSLWGVRMDDQQVDATYDALVAADVLVPVSDLRFVPQDSLLAAHAIVHGMVQHRSLPREYAPFRMLADLIDLKAWRLSSAAIQAPILGRVRPGDVVSACALASMLNDGEQLVDISQRSDEFGLLTWLVAASLDDDFQRVLGAQRFLELAKEHRLLAAIRRVLLDVASSSWPKSSTPATDRRERLGRPFDHGLRIVRGCAAFAKLRWRGSRDGW